MGRSTQNKRDNKYYKALEKQEWMRSLPFLFHLPVKSQSIIPVGTSGTLTGLNIVVMIFITTILGIIKKHCKFPNGIRHNVLKLSKRNIIFALSALFQTWLEGIVQPGLPQTACTQLKEVQNFLLICENFFLHSMYQVDTMFRNSEDHKNPF